MQKIINAVMATGHYINMDLFGQTTNGMMLRAKQPETTGLRLYVELGRRSLSFSLGYDESDDYLVTGIMAHYLMLDNSTCSSVLNTIEERLLDEVEWAEGQARTLYCPDLNLSDEEIGYIRNQLPLIIGATLAAVGETTYQLPSDLQQVILDYANYQINLTQLVTQLAAAGIEVVDVANADSINNNTDLAVELLGGNEVAYTVSGVNGKANELIFVI